MTISASILSPAMTSLTETPLVVHELQRIEELILLDHPDVRSEMTSLVVRHAVLTRSIN